MNICFIGPEGSGKGTQADIVAKRENVPHITTGDILRRRMNEQSATGELIRKTFAAGSYLSDEDMNPIFFERVSEQDCAQGFIADGFPRSIGQAQALDAHLQGKGQKLHAAVILEISEAESMKRLLLRKRFDDTEEKIKSRLAMYNKRAEPMIAYYKQSGRAVVINGEQPIEAVAHEIEEKLGEIDGQG